MLYRLDARRVLPFNRLLTANARTDGNGNIIIEPETPLLLDGFVQLLEKYRIPFIVEEDRRVIVPQSYSVVELYQLYEYEKGAHIYAGLRDFMVRAGALAHVMRRAGRNIELYDISYKVDWKRLEPIIEIKGRGRHFKEFLDLLLNRRPEHITVHGLARATA